MELILNNIEKSFGSKQVLKKASCIFEKGKIYGLLGRNGAGKTTLFNCISGDIEFERGYIDIVSDYIEKQPVLKDHSTVMFRNLVKPQDVGLVYSEPILPEFLTGYEFLKFYIDINKDKIRNCLTIEEYFEIIKIDEEDRYRLIKGYSHGMKNKLQMVCYLITRPAVILLDEPLTSFDVVVALEIKNLLKEIKSDHIIIFSTHILQLATDLCDEIVVLNNGTLEKLDNEILKSPGFEEKIIDILKESNDD